MTGEIDLIEEISSVASMEWEQAGLPLPLSAVGSRLSDGAKAIVRAQNISLRRYISEHISDRLRLLEMKRYGGGVVPRAAAENLSDIQLEDLYEKRPRKTDSPQFFQSVWRAFRTPLGEHDKRYLLVHEGRKTDYIDINEADESPTDGLEIVRDVILPPPHSNPETIEMILSWAKQNDVPSSLLAFADRPTAAVSSRRDSPVMPRADSRSDFEGALAYLTAEELARISIPGDVFFAALKRATQRRR
jgi:hypothetical protein